MKINFQKPSWLLTDGSGNTVVRMHDFDEAEAYESAQDHANRLGQTLYLRWLSDPSQAPSVIEPRP